MAIPSTRQLISTRREASWLALLAVLGFTFSHYVALSQRLDIMATLRNEMLLGLTSALFAVGVMLTDPMPLGAGRRVALSYLAFLVMVFIQVPFAMDRVAANFTFSEHVLKQSIFVFYVAVILRSPRHIALFLAVYLFALFYILQEAVRGLITGNLVWRNQGILRLHGAVDRYGHPNGLSLVGVSVLPFLFYMRAVWHRPWMRLAILGCFVAAVLCIVNTGSRAGYVSVVAGMVTLWLLNRHKVRNLLILCVVGAGAFLALPEQYKARFETIGGEEIEGASKEARMQLMLDAWEIFLDHPYGVGVDSFIYVRHIKYGGDRKRQEVHNLYLQILTHLGVQGLATFVWLIVALFRCHAVSLRGIRAAAADLRRDLRRREIPLDRRVERFLADVTLLESAILSIRFFMIMMLFNGMFAQTAYHILWCFIVGTSIATGAVAEHLVGVTRRYLRRLREEPLAV
jgi:putative inorganic carbon (hco3(-)) transporter